MQLMCSVESGYNPSHVVAHRVGEPQPLLASCESLQNGPCGSAWSMSYMLHAYELIIYVLVKSL